MGITGSASAEKRLRGKINALETIRGYSAYEIAMLNGFEGTEEEWLASLHGEDGADGEAGFVISETEPSETKPYVWINPNGDYGEAVTKDELQTAVDDALTEAKESGEFNPVKGEDYWTEEDQQQMVADVIDALPVYDGEVVQQ